MDDPIMHGLSRMHKEIKELNWTINHITLNIKKLIWEACISKIESCISWLAKYIDAIFEVKLDTKK